MICTDHRILIGCTNKNELCGACGSAEERRGAYRVLVG